MIMILILSTNDLIQESKKPILRSANDLIHRRRWYNPPHLDVWPCCRDQFPCVRRIATKDPQSSRRPLDKHVKRISDSVFGFYLTLPEWCFIRISFHDLLILSAIA